MIEEQIHVVFIGDELTPDCGSIVGRYSIDDDLIVFGESKIW